MSWPPTTPPRKSPTFVDTVISLFPQNLASHWANGEVVPIVVFCILVAITLQQDRRQEARGGRPLQEVYRRR
ncbi:MAG: cation:dicarboxylate symporter family transporter [Faecalibacterium prausnitzii]